MKNKWSKYLIIGLLVVSGLTSAGYFSGKQTNFWSKLFKSAEAMPMKIKKDTPVASEELYRQSVLREAQAKQSGSLKTCYEAFLGRTPSVDEGTVLVTWMIKGDGSMNDLTLGHSDLSDAEFHDCVLTNVGDMKFAPPPNPFGVMVSHKYHFKKRDIGNVSF